MEIYEKYKYYIEDDYVVLDKYIGKEKNVVVPEKIDDHPVLKISMQTFSKNETITSVTLPNGITEIWEFAFRGCTALKKVTLPETISLIERGAFDKCINLESVEIADTNHKYKSIDGVVYTANTTAIIVYPAAKSGECYTIEQGTEIIESYTFSQNKYLKTVTIPDSVSEINGWGFFGCESLEKVVIEGDLKDIGVYAFSECKKLKEFEIPDGISALESSVFYDCPSLHKLVCPKNFKGAGKHTFFNCPIDELHLHKGTKPMNILSDVENEFMLYITYDDGSKIPVVFNRIYFYSRFNIETAGSLDFKKYDNFFKTASKSMTPSEIRNVALNRITSEIQPVSSAVDMFISTLKKIGLDEKTFDEIEITPKNAALTARLASELGYSSKAAAIASNCSTASKKYGL